MQNVFRSPLHSTAQLGLPWLALYSLTESGRTPVHAEPTQTQVGTHPPLPHRYLQAHVEGDGRLRRHTMDGVDRRFKQY